MNTDAAILMPVSYFLELSFVSNRPTSSSMSTHCSSSPQALGCAFFTCAKRVPSRLPSAGPGDTSEQSLPCLKQKHCGFQVVTRARCREPRVKSTRTLDFLRPSSRGRPASSWSEYLRPSSLPLPTNQNRTCSTSQPGPSCASS